ncbi:MAG TPA: 2'-5' RNA ligase family protein [Phnomibacter sp.]|nr:2'-5' RNA ligase family protein [Phnomibacter sp.]
MKQHDELVGDDSHFVPGQGTYEYLLVANPDNEIGTRVMAEKQSFSQRYKESIAVKTRPHITVVNWLADECMEKNIARFIQMICNRRQSFQVVLHNFGGFPRHTLFVRVQNPGPFQGLVKELRVIDGYVRMCGFPAARLISNPHLTIARRLDKDVYAKAMVDFAQHEFHGSFVVQNLVLLKRKNQFDRCEKINVFSFKPGVLSQSYSSQLYIF